MKDGLPMVLAKRVSWKLCIPKTYTHIRIIYIYNAVIHIIYIYIYIVYYILYIIYYILYIIYKYACWAVCALYVIGSEDIYDQFLGHMIRI